MTLVPLKSGGRNYVSVKTYVFTFGQYSGKDFATVWKSDPTYIDWVASNNILPLPKKTFTTGSYNKTKTVADHDWIRRSLDPVPVCPPAPVDDDDVPPSGGTPVSLKQLLEDLDSGVKPPLVAPEKEKTPSVDDNKKELRRQMVEKIIPAREVEDPNSWKNRKLADTSWIEF